MKDHEPWEAIEIEMMNTREKLRQIVGVIALVLVLAYAAIVIWRFIL